jgi:phosphatidylinositol-3-phosphatase
MEGRNLLKKWGLLLLSVIFILSACTNESQTQNNPKKQNQTHQKTTNKTGTKEIIKEGKFPKINKIVIVVEENHSQEQIIGNLSASYINSLISKGANLTNNHGIHRPSQPNYLDMFSGSNQNISDNEVPKSKFSAANLGSELIEKNYTFAGYSEDLPLVGFDGKTNGHYVRKHNPWVNFSNLPKEANQPFANFPDDFNQLPTISFVIPNQQNNMHDGTIEKADQWLKQNIDPYVHWAQKNNSLLIVTWDEDNGTKDNTIPTFFVGPMVKPGEFNEKLNHYYLLRTLEDLYGLAHAGESNSVKPITSIWK